LQDDQRVGDLRESHDDWVNVGDTHADSVADECGIGTAVYDDAAALGAA